MVVEGQFSARRLGLWAPPASFLCLFLLVLAGAPNAAGALTYGLFSAITGFWMVRSLRAGVVLTNEGVELRGQFRTSKYRWEEIDGGVVGPMRTASPFAGRFPYENLVIRLRDGKLRRFPELSARQGSHGAVEAAAEAISKRTQ